jgi:hypothetical protein
LQTGGDLTVKATRFKIGYESISISKSTRVLIDPSYGYGIYLSSKDFDTAITKINSVFSSFRDQITNDGVCNTQTGECVIEYSYDYFKQTMKKDYFLELTLEGNNEMDLPFIINIPEEQMAYEDPTIFSGAISWARIPIYRLD